MRADHSPLCRSRGIYCRSHTFWRTVTRAQASIIALLLIGAACAAGADKVVLVAGGGVGRDGAPATRAQLDRPFGVAQDAKGRLLIIEFADALRAIESAGQIATLAGDGAKGDSGDGGPASAA